MREPATSIAPLDRRCQYFEVRDGGAVSYWCAAFRGPHPLYCVVHRPEYVPPQLSTPTRWESLTDEKRLAIALELMRHQPWLLSTREIAALKTVGLHLEATKRREAALFDRQAGKVSATVDKWMRYFRQHRRLTDAETWSMRCWNADGGDPYSAPLVQRNPTRCELCHASPLTWNGTAWYCDQCQHPNFPDFVEHDRTYERWGEPADRFPLAASDAYYAQVTALYRQPAALNWPFGRHRTHVRRCNEGKPRR